MAYRRTRKYTAERLAAMKAGKDRARMERPATRQGGQAGRLIPPHSGWRAARIARSSPNEFRPADSKVGI